MDEGSSTPELYPMDVGESMVEDGEMLYPEDSGMDSFRSEVEDDLS